MTQPIASMTGFARTSGIAEGLSWAWELRSVNGRGLDLKLRLPHGFDALEPRLREAAAGVLSRGNVGAVLTARREEVRQFGVDQPMLDMLLRLAADTAARIPGAPPPRAELLLALPGVLRATSGEAEGVSEGQRMAATEGFVAALQALAAARQAEGGRLGQVLSAQVDQVASLCAEAAVEAALQPQAQRARMLEAISTLLEATPRLPEDRVAQEVALLASRSDVREELDRLASHIAAARALLVEGAAIGRRLDFLVQEFVRECNTLCAKSASTPLTAIGLRLKAVLEQMREQVQNVE